MLDTVSHNATCPSISSMTNKLEAILTTILHKIGLTKEKTFLEMITGWQC